MDKKDYIELLEVMVEQNIIPRLHARIDTMMRDAVTLYSLQVDEQVDKRLHALVARGVLRIDFSEDD